MQEHVVFYLSWDLIGLSDLAIDGRGVLNLEKPHCWRCLGLSANKTHHARDPSRQRQVPGQEKILRSTTHEYRVGLSAARGVVFTVYRS
jgi:hypothetical protein